MNTQNEFKRIMATQSEMALATSSEHMPNVRIVNFYYEDATKIVYFTTFGENDKVKEFEANPNVAFTTIPHGNTEHVKAKGIVKRSNRTIAEVAEGFTRKIPDYQDTLSQVGEFLVLYEVTFDTAVVTMDFENIDVITLG